MTARVCWVGIRDTCKTTVCNNIIIPWTLEAEVKLIIPSTLVILGVKGQHSYERK